MDDILNFIALQSRESKDGIQTTLTFTPAAIELIHERYGVDDAQCEQMLCSVIDQNENEWESIPECQRKIISEGVVNQIACEGFVVDQMEIDDYILMAATCFDDGEIQIFVLTEEDTGYI